MNNNVLLVSGVQPSGSVIHIHVSVLFQIPFPFRLLQNIEQKNPNPNEMKSEVLSLLRFPDGNWIQLADLPVSLPSSVFLPLLFSFLPSTHGCTIRCLPRDPHSLRGVRAAQHPTSPPQRFLV